MRAFIRRIVRAGLKGFVAYMLKKIRFAGMDFELKNDVNLERNNVVLRSSTWERKDVSVLPVNLDAGRSHIDGLHAESGDGHDGDDREHEGENQPLVLP